MIGDAFMLAYNASWPLVKLTATAESIDIVVLPLLVSALPWKKYSFRRDEINQLSLFKGWVSTGLKITHSRKDLPPFVVFWTLSFDKLRAGLEALGYIVEAPDVAPHR